MSVAPYDIWNTVIQTAKTRLNDTVPTLAAESGKLLDLLQPHVQRMCGASFRKFQEFLATLKYSGMEQEVNFLDLPAASTNDALVQVFINYAGYAPDGVVPPSNNSFVLPQGMIRPYKLWERAFTAGANPVVLTEMDEVINGLPSVPKQTWNRQWEWRDDTLYMPGATVATDIRVRYGSYFADPIDNSPASATPWFAQIVPILRCVDSLTDYLCREVEIARENPDAAAMFQASGEASARILVSRDTTQPQAAGSTAQLGKMRNKYTPMEGAPRTAKR